jgi:hypothetical protein
VAADAVKHGDQRLPPSGQSLPGARRNPIRHYAAAYRVSAREPRRPGPDDADRARTGGRKTAMTARKGGMACLVIDCRKTVRAAFYSAAGVAASARCLCIERLSDACADFSAISRPGARG